MQIWIKLRKNQRTVEQFSSGAGDVTYDGDWLRGALLSGCEAFDLPLPVILDKHVNELSAFARTVFRADDFLEPLRVDAMEVELFDEEEDKKRGKEGNKRD